MAKRKYSPIEEIEIQLTLADKISRLALHTANVNEVAQKTVKELSGLMPIDRATLVLIDKPAEKITLRALVGNANSEEEKVIPLPGTPYAWVVERKQALLEPGPKGE